MTAKQMRTRGSPTAVREVPGCSLMTLGTTADLKIG